MFLNQKNRNIYKVFLVSGEHIRPFWSSSSILSLMVSSADNLGKQPGFKLFDILMVLLKEFFEKVDFEKNQQTTKKSEKLPSMQRVK